MKAKKLWLILGGLFLVLGGVITVLVGPDYMELVSAARTLEAELNRAKKVGNPLKASDLIAPQPPESQNATIEFEQSRKLASDPKFLDRIDAFQEAVLTSDFAFAEELSNKLQPIVLLAQRVAAKPLLVSGRNVDAINELGYGVASHGKNLVRLLCIQAQLDYHKGDFEKGNANLRAGIAIGSLISQDPLYINLLVESSCRGMVFATMEKLAILNRSRLDVLEKLDTDVPSPPPLNLYHALRGEAYFGTVPLRNLDALGGWKAFVNALDDSNSSTEVGEDAYGALVRSVDPASLRKEGVPERTGEKAFFARHLAFWNDTLEQAKRTKDPLELATWMRARKEKLHRETGPSYRLVKSLVQTFERMGAAVATAEAIEWGRRGLIKVLIYRAKSGRYPETLVEAGFTELDPFSKKPYRFVVDGDVVKVYSVGPNGVDDEVAKKVDVGTEGTEPDDIGGDTDRKDGYPIL